MKDSLDCTNTKLDANPAPALGVGSTIWNRSYVPGKIIGANRASWLVLWDNCHYGDYHSHDKVLKKQRDADFPQWFATEVEMTDYQFADKNRHQVASLVGSSWKVLPAVLKQIADLIGYTEQ